MRRFLTTIVCVLCVLAAYAVSYGTSYKGSGYTGRIYTTSSARTTSIGSGGIIASAPMAVMGSTSAYQISQMSHMGTSGTGMVRGVYPSGLTHTPLTAGILPPELDCHCVDTNGDHICDNCGAPLDDDDECSNNPCWCPIGDGWQVWLFMAAMAFVYAAIKKRHSHQTETVPSRPGCE